MSEQENNSRSEDRVASVIMVEKTSRSCPKSYRPNELQNDAERHHKHSKAPVVPCTYKIMQTYNNSEVKAKTIL